LAPVKLVICNGKLRMAGHEENKDDTPWIKTCTTTEGMSEEDIVE